MSVFMDLYHPDVLRDLLKKDSSGVELMHRLFNDAEMGEQSENQGLLNWLVCKRLQNPAANNMIIFGRTGEFNQSGILRKSDGYYDYSGKKTDIDESQAIACALETFDVIEGICKFINNSIIENVVLDGAWYKELDKEIKRICGLQKHNPLWFGESKDYQLRPYLIKYFHLLYPEIIAGFYSRKHIKIALALLGEAYSEDLSVIENNGRISCKMHKLLPNNPSGIRFAKALYPKVYEISDKTV